MPTPPPNAPCPCGSGAKYKKCCRPFHEGAPAPTPEALMRSRFSAYATGLSRYLIATTDPEGPQWSGGPGWEAELDAHCRATTFESLVVDAAEASGDEGFVTFHVVTSRGGARSAWGERSRFLRRGGRWLYHSGARA